MQIKSIGIALGKTTFHLIALGTHSQIVIRKKFSRQHLLNYTANLDSCLIGMEAGEHCHICGCVALMAVLTQSQRRERTRFFRFSSIGVISPYRS
jgi:hypothetical protein